MPAADELRAKRRRDFMSKAAMTMFFTLCWLQIYNVKTTVIRAQELSASPISFTEFIPDKAEYVPGELIHFHYTRTCNPSREQPLPILLLQLDTFENIGTGEVFQGTMASRIVKRSGSENLNATRIIPKETTPGTYIFEGWASSQVSRLSKATAYSSGTFKVVAPQKEFAEETKKE